MATKTKAKGATTTANANYVPVSLGMGEEKWIDIDGYRTRYFDAGKGERIVFVHGVQMGSTDGSSSARTWELNFPVLAAHHDTNIVRPHRPGLHRQPQDRRRLHDARQRAACDRLPR